jgi:hypothetical protein
MPFRLRIMQRTFVILLLMAVSSGTGYGEESQISMEETVSANWLLRRPVRPYKNYAFDLYSNYQHHTLPQPEGQGADEFFYPRSFYDGIGNHLATGYDLFSWHERRQPQLQRGSSIFKNEGNWTEAFKYVAMAHDGYGEWGYNALVGDGLTARFTPLTLSLVDFSGFRFDLSTPYLKVTTLASRIQRPYSPRGFDYVRRSGYHVGNTMFAGDSSLLLGGRLEAVLGNADLGLNLANLHVYDSGRADNSIRGILRPGQPLVDWVVVRFSDDSPQDGDGGAVIQDIVLLVNGVERRDITPQVIRHRADVRTQVGTYSRVTGEFISFPYFIPSTGFTTFYRGRGEIALYADYLFRLDHEAGVDVSRQTNLAALLSTLAVEPSAGFKRADGEDQLAYLFDVSTEPHLESIEVEALVGNDYRVDVATLWEESPRGQGYGRFKSDFYRTVLRARDNVHDLSNLKRVRFQIGEDTAIFTYSADLSLQLAGLELNGEYARSSLYRRFPAEDSGEPSFDRGTRFANRGSAYFINATRSGERWGFGGEYFAMNPDFTTTMRSFVPVESIVTDRRSTLRGLSNETIYWDLVQDNEDGDQFPDKRVGYTTGSWFRNDGLEVSGIDPDGVYMGQDEDKDGYPDINRNGDGLPDYLEPFLMYEVESNDYTYGLDRNNNDEPDHREDDWEPDYPYDQGQRGFHLFGQTRMTPHWNLALGRYDVEKIAGGINQSTYALLTYRRQSPEHLRRVFFENHFRRVHDSIPDEYNILTENRQFTGDYRYFVHFVYWGNRSFAGRPRQDLLWYENSYVNETYLENWVQPWSRLNLVQKIRLRVNWQRGGRQSGGFIAPTRRLDHWTVVNRIDFTWSFRKFSIQPKLKLQMVRLVDQEQDQTMRFEYELIPILLLSRPLAPRTTARLGIQGWGPVPYRFADKKRSLDSFERRTSIATITNESSYFGYKLFTIVGAVHDAQTFDSKVRKVSNFDTFSFFVRALVGFPDHANLLL